jgi:excisionase family DNA binding protein
MSLVTAIQNERGRMPHTERADGRIGPGHRRRAAYVYVRQSTMTQVETHLESRERQYELVQRAVALGWRTADVVVIDSDLARSGAEATQRTGFQRLVADVGLGRVGLVLGIEVSRLARNNTDWYQLLDLCALCDTLIADADGVYHPGAYNDRLLLGLKGTMSEAELHLIRSRLTGGLWHKAAKGELRFWLPIGYEHDPAGRIVLSPDEGVRAAMALVFRKFEEFGSARRIMTWMVAEGLQLPTYRPERPAVRWVRPSYPLIHGILTNVTYAGAYAYGRTREEKVVVDGQIRHRIRRLPREEWEVLLRDHHPAYISWDQYLVNQERLRANVHLPGSQVRGAPRSGSALLQGLLRCGLCGRRMQVSYSGTRGNVPRYACRQATGMQGLPSACQSLGGHRLEKTVVDTFLLAVTPARIEATLQALQDAQAEQQAVLAQWELRLEQARYETERARRQYDAVEPEHRLVARTLEREWERRLAEQAQVERELEHRRLTAATPLDAEEVAHIRRFGIRLQRVWQAPTTEDRDRKQLLRTLIQEIIVQVDRTRRVADLTIVWEGGATSHITSQLNRTGHHFHATGESTVELIGDLAHHYPDDMIARVLVRQGRRTGQGHPFTAGRVQWVRRTHDIPAYDGPPPLTTAGYFTIQQAEAELGVSNNTIRRWLDEGLLVGTQVASGAPWQIAIDDEVRKRVRPEAPPGWLPLDEAAAALKVSRQTVLHWVQSGRLEAIYVTNGKRRGLRIRVDGPTLRLIE